MIKVNGRKVTIDEFPIGEKKINEKSILLTNNNVIVMKWEEDGDFMNLLFIKRFIDRYAPRSNNVLNIAYLPYSRMDREMGGMLFTLQSLCEFINFLDFSEVIVNECHSDVAVGMIRNCVNKPLVKRIYEYADIEADYVFYPDAGAAKKYGFTRLPELVGMKERDLTTGRIKKYDVFGEFEEGANIVMLDDLCSYGGTFDLAATKLKEKGAGKIFLIVGHCEESILSGNLFDNDAVTGIFTSNSIIPELYESRRTKLSILNFF